MTLEFLFVGLAIIAILEGLVFEKELIELENKVIRAGAILLLKVLTKIKERRDKHAGQKSA